jgi:hypothetical protein
LHDNDESSLYFSDGARRTLEKIAISGEARQMLAAGVSVRDLKLKAGALYYVDDTGRLLRMSPDGGEPDALLSTADADVAVIDSDGETLYWADASVLLSAPADDTGEPSALGVAGPGPAAGSHGRIERLMLRDDTLFWSDAVGNIGWTAVDGSDCGLLIANVPELGGWDIDDDALYLTLTAEGGARELWRVAR